MRFAASLRSAWPPKAVGKRFPGQLIDLLIHLTQPGHDDN
jgi:hypothetical protein